MSSIQESLECLRKDIAKQFKIADDDPQKNDFVLLKYIEYTHDICASNSASNNASNKSTEDYQFDVFNDDELRTSNYLILLAIYLMLTSKKKVLFISPTYYYAQQAFLMGDKYLRGLQIDKSFKFPCAIPGHMFFDGAVLEADILLMHGSDFSKYLPKEWNGRKIVQNFSDDVVPVDPRRPSSSWHIGSQL